MDGIDKVVVYGSQSQDLRASNNYLTSVLLPLDEYCVFTAELPAGMIVPLHSHADRESFYVLSGEMTLYYEDSWHVVAQGACVDVVSNAKHAWHNASTSSPRVRGTYD